jgi:hypothetical protein
MPPSCSPQDSDGPPPLKQKEGFSDQAFEVLFKIQRVAEKRLKSKGSSAWIPLKKSSGNKSKNIQLAGFKLGTSRIFHSSSGPITDKRPTKCIARNSFITSIYLQKERTPLFLREVDHPRPSNLLADLDPCEGGPCGFVADVSRMKQADTDLSAKSIMRLMFSRNWKETSELRSSALTLNLLNIPASQF